MFTIRIADLTIEIHNQYAYVEDLCRDYLVANVDTPDMRIVPTGADIAYEHSLSDVTISQAYAEGICVYRLICRQLPANFQSFLLHGAVIEYEGRGYIFTAKSGTGKSTHVALWQKQFGKDVHVVNGDKPILRFAEDSLYAYGTPWCGKEGYQTNMSVPVAGICFLERAPHNEIHRISAEDALTRIFHQILTPSDLATFDALVPLLDRTLTQIPCYLLKCNISEEAAVVAYTGMNGEKKTGEEK